jgi:hypothetical protein
MRGAWLPLQGLNIQLSLAIGQEDGGHNPCRAIRLPAKPLPGARRFSSEYQKEKGFLGKILI